MNLSWPQHGADDPTTGRSPGLVPGNDAGDDRSDCIGHRGGAAVRHRHIILCNIKVLCQSFFWGLYSKNTVHHRFKPDKANRSKYDEIEIDFRMGLLAMPTLSAYRQTLFKYTLILHLKEVSTLLDSCMPPLEMIVFWIDIPYPIRY